MFRLQLYQLEIMQKLLQQLKSSFERTIDWNNCQSEPNQYLDNLIDPSFQWVNRHRNRNFVLSFENNAVRTRHTRYFLPTVKIKNYNLQNVFDQPTKNDLRIYDNIQKNCNWSRR